jgi:ABC-type cobalamin/Fe3+-siderophores transport system ATPase subunit
MIRVNNFKRIRNASISLVGRNVIHVTGGNGAGKSSFLDGIMATLSGYDDKDMKNITEPVNREAHDASVQIQTDDGLLITRQWYSGGKYTGSGVRISQHGNRVSDPAAFLENVMGRVAFNPMTFRRMNPDQQVTELRKLLNIDEELGSLDREDGVLEEKAKPLRSELNAKRLELQQTPFIPNLPSQPHDIGKIETELAEVAEFNRIINEQQATRDRYVVETERISQQAAELRQQIREMQKQLKGLDDSLEMRTETRDSWPKLDERKDAQDVLQSLQLARAANNSIRDNEKALRLTNDVEALSQRQQEISIRRAEIECQIKEVISEARFPVEGLAFDGAKQVLYKGLPFFQASTAEQVKVSVMIGMAGNPALRFMILREGNDLDRKSLKVIDELADTYDFQVLVERVDLDGYEGIFFEDGEITRVDGKEHKSLPPLRKSEVHPTRTRRGLVFKD